MVKVAPSIASLLSARVSRREFRRIGEFVGVAQSRGLPLRVDEANSVSCAGQQHFDVLARMELIDAVDADGDGRGELLFRQVSDAGSVFILYRVIGDRLWPLFQGAPGQ